MKFEAEIIKDIVDSRGHTKTSIHYQSECVEEWVKEVEGAYPKLCDYQPEWLNYSAENKIGVFPYATLTDITNATVENVVPYAYKRAILKGNTGYRDIDTGEILETFEEGRNLELVTVKMPVLTTIGKNLFQVTFEQGSIYSVEGKPVHSTTRARSIDFIKLTKGNTYTFSVDSSQENSNIMFREILTYSTNDYNSFKVGNLGTYKKQFTYTPTEDEYIKFVLINNTTPEGVVDINEVKIQIEYGTQATTYEPYKSNILTVNEDIELRGIGDVQDTLDCLTGEVTQRIGEIVLNGSQNIDNDGDLLYYYLPFGVHNNISKSDKLPSINVDQILDGLTGVAPQNRGDASRVYINIDGITTKEEMKNYFANNNVKIQYQLTTESVKTVDLSVVDQDGKTLEQIKPIEGTMHLNTSGETVKPLFSGEIPVEAITQNLASFIEG